MDKITEKYGIAPMQKWIAADGSGHMVQVLDVVTFENQSDVVVQDLRQPEKEPYRIDAFKLAKVRYELWEDIPGR